jgi:hypothetical protein
MAQQNPREEPFLFRGVNLYGNPTRRPRFTADLCQNFRIMQGNGIRLRGGRVGRRNTVGGTIQQLHSFRDPNFLGSNSHMAKIRTGSSVRWSWFDLSTYTPDPFTNGTIETANDGGYALDNLAAVTNITDRPLFYNGLGVQNGTNSRPPFCTYFAGITRYFGLDAHCPSGKPTVAFSTGGGFNNCLERIKFAVGLYHEPTGHYSNGVEIGEIGPTVSNGVVTVSNLNRLTAAFNNATEQGELYYVFYATIDGFQTYYLIMNAALTGPQKVSIASTSASLSVADTDNGFVLDVTTEMPIANFPPRPMRWIAYLNGRLYGSPLQGGAGSYNSAFTYQWGSSREYASIVWSAAAGDDRETKQVGDPLQSWPLQNIESIPNAEVGIFGMPSISESSLLVWTASSLFLLSELTNGIHVWRKLSPVHGLMNPSTVRVTPYGIAWVNQLNQICLLESEGSENSPATITILSRRYQTLLRGQTVNCANYIADPTNEIDRYEVFCASGLSVCHDFLLRDNEHPEGQAYTSTGQDYTAAATLVTREGVRHYVVAKGGFYTHEAQPENGLIPTTDQTFTDTSTQTRATSQINGAFRYNWDDFSGFNERKLLASVSVIGDGKPSPALGNASPLSFRWWGDYEYVHSSTEKVEPILRSTQTQPDWRWQINLKTANRFVFKIELRLAGHSSDSANFANYPPVETEGNLQQNFYGSIWSAAYLIGNRGNLV